MKVSKMVDQDVSAKVDIQYIREQLAHVHNIGILFVCKKEDDDEGDDDDWVDQDSGMRYLIIHLPYKHVKQSADDLRPFMLARAKERLGLATGSLPN